MPRISAFYGIVIMMRLREHQPPHFHAQYGEFEASIEIATLGVRRSSLPPRQLGLVVEWAAMHQEELLGCWNKAQSGELPSPIPPLP